MLLPVTALGSVRQLLTIFYFLTRTDQLAINIQIISATPGISTHEKILDIIQTRNTGITIKEISKTITRPISMVQLCLKDLISSKDIFSRQNRAGVGMIYYPR